MGRLGWRNAFSGRLDGSVCQTSKSPRRKIGRPVINIFLPEGPGEAILLDYFGFLPTTSIGNNHI